MRQDRSILLGAVVVIVVALTAAGCGGTKTVTKTVTVTSTTKTGFGPPAELAQFGYNKSLKRKGSGYEMRFDPAWYLSGVTANIAAAEDGAVPAVNRFQATTTGLTKATGC